MSGASAYRGARVMVLGAAGFIGRWVARALAERGAVLDLVVRNPAQAQGVLRAWGVHGSIIAADLSDAALVGKMVALHAPAAVFNLAGYGVDPTERDATMAVRLNTELPEALAAAMADAGDPSWRGQQVVHAGSALEYGTAGGDLEERTPGSPTTLYGRTKLGGTERLLAAARGRNVRAVVGRLFTVYGPGELDGRLLPTLLASAAGRGPIPLSAGAQQRDFTYVQDAANALVELGQSPAPMDIVNVATGRLTAVRGFVETAAGILGVAPERLVFGAVPTRLEEMQHAPVNVERLRHLVGRVPSTTIADGVERTAAFRPSAT